MTISNTNAPAVPGAQVGERILLTSPTEKSRRAGVLLPPVRAGEPHRVHTDKGPVLRLDGTWLATPERAAADRRRDRRRQQCDAGRPIYRHTDLPAQLATKTMLQRQFRRRPAEGQDPIASYMISGGRNYSPLYAVIDAEKLPALPPGRRAAWDQARTCARCRSTTTTPYSKAVDGRRYCKDCHEPAAAAWWYAERAAGRVEATAWATRLLADVARAPDSVALVCLGYPSSAMSQDLLVETWSGDVLLTARICDSDTFFHEGKDTRPADLAEALKQLAGRRLITWRGDEHWLGLLQTTMRPHTGDLALTFSGGRAGPQWDEWKAERRPDLNEPYPFWYEHRLYQQASPPRAELLAHVRHVVHEMATRACYWWRATCLDTGCGVTLPFGSGVAADRWAERHHRDTGHIVGHTTEPGTVPPSLSPADGRESEAGHG